MLYSYVCTYVRMAGGRPTVFNEEARARIEIQAMYDASSSLS